MKTRQTVAPNTTNTLAEERASPPEVGARADAIEGEDLSSAPLPHADEYEMAVGACALQGPKPDATVVAASASSPVQNALPGPHNQTAPLKERIASYLAQHDRGSPLQSQPDVSGLTYLIIDDRRPLDGDLREAFFDTDNNQFYVKSTGAGLVPDPSLLGPFWYGPFDLRRKDPDIK